jgi:hypothetical protein
MAFEPNPIARDPQELVDNTLVLAKAIHEEYNKGQRAEGKKVTEWDDLPDDLVYSNIRQARGISTKLALIGCYTASRPRSEGDELVTEFTEEELDLMSRLEHDMWVEERESTGWVYGPEKDDDRKISPYMIPWEYLSDGVKKLDTDTCTSMFGLLSGIGLHVYRRKSSDTGEDPVFLRSRSIPIIISVTGHINTTEDTDIEGGLDKLVGMLREKFPNTPEIILMSALAEGADRRAARAALELKLTLAPVLPMPVEVYKQTFTGQGYRGEGETDEDIAKSAIDKSCKDFDDILKKATVGKCVLNGEGVNPANAYRDLATYLAANSHIMVAVWDGRETMRPGGTYDAIRMAIDGADPDLLQFASPKVSAAEHMAFNAEHFVNSSEDCLIYWIKAEREEKVEKKTEEKPGEKAQKEPEERIVDRDCTVGDIQWPCFIVESYTGDQKDPPKGCVEIHKGTEFFTSQEIPDHKVSSLTMLDGLNKDLAELFEDSDLDAKDPGFSGYRPDSLKADYHGLLPDDAGTGALEGMKSSGYMAEMAGRYAAVRDLAERYGRKSRRALLALTVMTVLYTIFFNLLILFSSSILVVGIYTAIYILCNIKIIHYDRKRIYPKFVEYRLLADALKIEFYWAVLGINDTTGSNSYVLTRNGLNWMRDVMRGCSTYFANGYSKVRRIRPEALISLVEVNWVESKVTSILDKADSDYKSNLLYKRLGSSFAVVTTIMTIVTVSIVILSLDFMTDEVISINDPINGKSMSFSAYTFIKIAMIVLVNSTALLALKKGSLRFSKTDQAEASYVLFNSALSKLRREQRTSNRKATAARMAVFHELGSFSLQESADYAVESMAVGEVKRPALLNSKNRVKDREEGDAFKAAEDIIDRSRSSSPMAPLRVPSPPRISWRMASLNTGMEFWLSIRRSTLVLVSSVTRIEPSDEAFLASKSRSSRLKESPSRRRPVISERWALRAEQSLLPSMTMAAIASIFMLRGSRPMPMK